MNRRRLGTCCAVGSMTGIPLLREELAGSIWRTKKGENCIQQEDGTQVTFIMELRCMGHAKFSEIAEKALEEGLH